MATTLSITINKSRVIDEAQKASAYIGKKLTTDKDPDAYERIAALDADREQLDRYWMEACDAATTSLSHWLVSVDDQMLGHHADLTRDYHAELSLPSNWNTHLASATKSALMSFIINSIVAKWCLLARSDAAEASAASAATSLSLVETHLMSRLRPASRTSGGGGGGHGDINHVLLTQAEYDAIGAPDENTIYMIYEDA